MTNADAASQFERLHIEAADLIRLAEAEASPGVARVLRRMAGGKRAAATRLGRRAGFLD